MKVWTLLENTACREDLTAEHGLSLYIETAGRRLLFDAGETGAFADNAAKLGVDLSRVDMCVLSHGHSDHGGGLPRFLEENAKAKIYVNQNAFRPYYNAAEEYIGLDPALAENDRVVLVEDTLTLADGICLYSSRAMPSPYGVESFGLQVLEAGIFRPDDFCHEQYLLIREGEKKILFSGCSHRGILNIMDRFRPDILVGGFHFMKLDPNREEIKKAARILDEYPTVYYTGHCTGAPQFATMKEILGERLQSLSTGAALTL